MVCLHIMHLAFFTRLYLRDCLYVGLQPFYYSHGFPSHNLFNCLAHSESLAILTTAAARFLTHIPYTHKSLSVGWIVMRILIQRECASPWKHYGLCGFLPGGSSRRHSPPTVQKRTEKSPSLEGSYHSRILPTGISLALLSGRWDGHPLNPGLWAGWSWAGPLSEKQSSNNKQGWLL